MGKIVGLLSTGIGLGRELYVANSNKSKSQSQLPEPQQSNAPVRSASRTDAPPPYSSEQYPANTESRDYRYEDEKHSSDFDDEEDDEEDWDLDDAQGEVSRPQESIVKGENSEVTVNRIVQDFVHSHPGAMRRTNGRLPYPVILPQRRPENRERGFIRAYAPDLLECGIDQATFLDFIEAMNKASKASPVFDVINIGAAAAGFAPSIIAQIVSTAVNVGTMAAKSASIKRQSNGFIEKMNNTLFKPHGLFCLIMTFKPGQGTESRPMDISSSILKSATKATSRIGNFSKSSGKAMGEIELPEAAPLIFPALDQAQAAGNTGGFSGFQNTVADYFDRRAQAKYMQQNPDSKLSIGQTPQFASRFGDPNHPMNSGGGLRGLITSATGRGDGGGRQGLISSVIGREGVGRRSRRAGRRERRSGGGYDDNQTMGSSQPRAGRRDRKREKGGGLLRGGIKRFMQQDILYIMIVNMPSEAEMAAFRNGTQLSPNSSSYSSGPSASSAAQYPPPQQQQQQQQGFYPPQEQSYQQSQYQNSYQQPSHQQPGYQQPSYQQSTSHQQPGHQQPYQQPGYQQPQYEAGPSQGYYSQQPRQGSGDPSYR